VRTPPHITRRDSLGVPAQALGIALGRLPRAWVGPLAATLRRLTIPDLAPYGLPLPREHLGEQFARTGTIPILDVGFVDAVRTGRVEVVAAVTGFDAREAPVHHQSRLAVDVVLAATGFRAGLEPLVGHLGVLGRRGLPDHTDGGPSLPGLWFVGFTPTLGGQLREGSLAARRVATALAAELSRGMETVRRVDDDPDRVTGPDLAQ